MMDDLDPILPEIDTDILKHNQRHVSAKTSNFITTVRAMREPKLDRNGKPIPGEFVWNPARTFPCSLNDLQELRAIDRRKVEERFEKKIKELQSNLIAAHNTLKKTQIALVEKTRVVRTLAKEHDPTRIERRIRDAVCEASERDQHTIRELHEKVAQLERENAELRDAKRRLKAAGRKL